MCQATDSVITKFSFAKVHPKPCANFCGSPALRPLCGILTGVSMIWVCKTKTCPFQILRCFAGVCDFNFQLYLSIRAPAFDCKTGAQNRECCFQAYLLPGYLQVRIWPVCPLEWILSLAPAQCMAWMLILSSEQRGTRQITKYSRWCCAGQKSPVLEVHSMGVYLLERRSKGGSRSCRCSPNGALHNIPLQQRKR